MNYTPLTGAVIFMMHVYNLTRTHRDYSHIKYMYAAVGCTTALALENVLT